MTYITLFDEMLLIVLYPQVTHCGIYCPDNLLSEEKLLRVPVEFEILKGVSGRIFDFFALQNKAEGLYKIIIPIPSP